MKNFIKNISLSILVLVVFFGGLELTQRIRYSVIQKNKMYLLYGIKKIQYAGNSQIRKIDTFKEILVNGLKGVPGTYSREYDGKVFPVHINALGFRGDEIEPEKRKDILRIAMLGGSSVLGFETPDDKTVTSMLQERFNKDKDFLRNINKEKVEVINAGVGGAASPVVLLTFKKEILPLKPDIIIVYCAFNNIRKTQVVDGAGNYRRNFIIKLLGENLWERLYSHSLLFASIYEKYYLFCKKKISLKLAEDMILKRYREDIGSIIDTAKSNGIKTILVKQPLYIKNFPILQDEKEVARIRNEININGKISYEEAYYWLQSSLLEILDETAFQHNVVLIDPIKQMEDNKESLFYDIVHRNEKGNEVLADIIYQSIKIHKNDIWPIK